MGRTYRRNDYHNSWGKSLRDKRSRGSTRNNWESTSYDEYKPKKLKNKKNREYDFNNSEYSDYD